MTQLSRCFDDSNDEGGQEGPSPQALHIKLRL